MAAAIDKYMFISVNRPIVDDLVRIKYSNSETVTCTSEVQHELARTALQSVGISRAIEIISMADIPQGTGLGSSSCYMVGLLKALFELQRKPQGLQSLAEHACHLEINILKKPVGKQDPYLATYGGLPVLEISQSGEVLVRPTKIDFGTLDDLNRNILIFYTGKTRQADDILRHQDARVKESEPIVTQSLHRIKDLGYEILEALEAGNLDDFGLLMDKHWQNKIKLSSKIAEPRHHRLYEIAKENGALGGKVTGAGGGGFFVFYTASKHRELRRAMQNEGLRELRYRFDREGCKTLVNLSNGRDTDSPEDHLEEPSIR